MRLKTALFIQNYCPINIRKAYANVFGYFWKNCPSCNEFYSGAESADDFQGYTYIKPIDLSETDKANFISKVERSDCTCPSCSREQLKEIRLRAIKILEAGNMNSRDISEIVKLEAYDLL